MKILLVIMLTASLAQILPSCGGGGSVSGWVEAKKVDVLGGAYLVMINGHEYEVPQPFWRSVNLGDLVKYDGNQWTIVRRANETPTPTPRPITSPSP